MRPALTREQKRNGWELMTRPLEIESLGVESDQSREKRITHYGNQVGDVITGRKPCVLADVQQARLADLAERQLHTLLGFSA